MARALPHYIYKYTSINEFLYETLMRSELWFNPPAHFNDPFDSFLPIDFGLECFKTMEGWETSPGLTKEVQSKALRPIIFRNELEELRNQMGVSCFSSVPDNLIMWSHYADKHKGLILKFGAAELQKVFYNIRSVIYTNRVKPLNYEKPASGIIDKLLTRKSTHWKAESEIRIIAKKHGPYSFPKSALKEIIFGLKCDSRQLTDIMHLIQKFGYPSTSFAQVQSENYEYKLRKDRVTWSSDKAYKPDGDKGRDEMLKILGIPVNGLPIKTGKGKRDVDP
jgi:hypothetical protein